MKTYASYTSGGRRVPYAYANKEVITYRATVGAIVMMEAWHLPAKCEVQFSVELTSEE